MTRSLDDLKMRKKKMTYHFIQIQWKQNSNFIWLVIWSIKISMTLIMDWSSNGQKKKENVLLCYTFIDWLIRQCVMTTSHGNYRQMPVGGIWESWSHRVSDSTEEERNGHNINLMIGWKFEDIPLNKSYQRQH